MLHETLTKKTVDYSTEKSFSFSFFCDTCGKEWRSTEKHFSGGICSVTESNEALQLLWACEHRAAFNEANLEAHFHFAECPVCGKRVCDACFEKEHGNCKCSEVEK